MREGRARAAGGAALGVRAPAAVRFGVVAAVLFLGAPALAAPPPRVTLEVPDLSRSAPLLVDLLRWASLAEPELAPSAIGARISSVIGVDPLSLKALRDVGVDPSKPVRVRLDGARRQLVLEAALSDPALARAHAEALARKLDGEPLAGVTGFVVGDDPTASVAVLVRDKVATVVIGAGYRPPRAAARTSTRTARRPPTPVDLARDRRLAVLGTKRGDTVRPPKALLDGAPVDAWMVIEPRDDVERVDLVLRGKPGDVTIGGEVALGMGAEVVLAEGLRGKATSTRLVDPGPIAVEVVTTLTRAGLREALARFGVPAALAAVLAGPVHLGITAEGTAFAAARLEAKADGPALTEALKKRVTGAEVRIVDGVAIAQIGPGTLALAKPDARAGSALVLEVVPREVLSALDRHRTLLGLRPMALMMARVLAARMIGATEAITVEASMPTNRLRFSARLRYRAL